MAEQLAMVEARTNLPCTIEQSNTMMADFFSYEPSMDEMREIGRYMATEEFAPHKLSAEPIHRFSDGMYVREVTIPAGNLVVGKRHAQGHVTFLMKGKATIVTDEGINTIEGPVGWVDEPGVQRAVYAYEDATFVTIHSTDLTDVAEIEKEIICKEEI